MIMAKENRVRIRKKMQVKWNEITNANKSCYPSVMSHRQLFT